jgi:hypothetical protein
MNRNFHNIADPTEVYRHGVPTIIIRSMVILGLRCIGITTVMPVRVLFLIFKTRADLAIRLIKYG